jgi:DNA-binding transcriptional LysR family regulator
MDLWQLHIFCKVVELKSFSKAGQDVHVSQPTVSSHIKDLETHFGCRLLDRLSKEVVPTPAGDLLYHYARKLLALRDDTEIALTEFQGRMRGQLVIGGSTIPSGYILPQIMGTFKSRYPEVTMTLTVADTATILKSLLANEIEIGVVGAKCEDRKIQQIKLVKDEMQLVVPPNHRWAKRKAVKLEMLPKEPFILREKGSGTRQSLQQCLKLAGYSIDALNITGEMGSTAAVIQSVKSGLGVSIMSRIAVSESIRHGTMCALGIAGLALERHFYLSWRHNRTASPLGRLFSDHLIASVNAEPERRPAQKNMRVTQRHES